MPCIREERVNWPAPDRREQLIVPFHGREVRLNRVDLRSESTEGTGGFADLWLIRTDH